MSPNNDFGKYLRELREGRKISVNRLAELIGISGAELSRIERGVRQKINPYLLRKVASVLNVDIGFLMVKAGFLPAGKPLLRTGSGTRFDELMAKAMRLESSDLDEIETLVDSMLDRPEDAGDADTEA